MDAGLGNGAGPIYVPPCRSTGMGVIRPTPPCAQRARVKRVGLPRHDPLAWRSPHFGEFAHRLQYQPVVTRDATEHPRQRLPHLIASGELEDLLDCKLSLERSKVMLCGNPQMLQDTRSALKARGFVSARSSRPGQIATENYW